MSTTLKINEAEDFMSPEDMEKFVSRSEFRSPDWRYTQTTGGKFTIWSMTLRGPNWFGLLQIKIVGEEWRTKTKNPYVVSAFVRQTDGPVLRSNDKFEIICRIKYGTDPKAIMPLLEAAMDEAAPQLWSLNIDDYSDLSKVIYKITFAVLPYLRGAGLIDAESVQDSDVEDEASQAIMESGEDTDMSQYAQVAVDAGLIGQWQNTNAGINNRHVDIYVAEVTVPNAEIIGYIDAFQGTEKPWLLHVFLEGRTKWRKIIAYTHTRPTQRLLDKFRDAALIAVRAAQEAEFPPMPGILGLDIEEQVDKALIGDPEIYAINYPERTNESQDDEVDSFVQGFLRTEGIKPWKATTMEWQGKHVGTYHHAEFQFRNIGGLIAFTERVMDNGEYVQELSLDICDRYTNETLTRELRSWSGGQIFSVPKENISQAIEALNNFLVDFLKPLAFKAKKGVVPFYNAKITSAFANTMQPWNTISESVDPEELWGDVKAHGGQPLEWKPVPEHAGYFVLRINWLDGSHRGVIGLVPTAQIWPHGYMVRLQLWARNATDGEWDEIFGTSSLVYILPKFFGQFQNRTIDFAKWLIATFNAENGMADSHIEINNRFKTATTCQNVRESTPEDMFKNFDWVNAMGPWKFYDGRNRTGRNFVRWDAWITSFKSDADIVNIGLDEAKLTVFQFQYDEHRLAGHVLVVLEAHSTSDIGVMTTARFEAIKILNTGNDFQIADRVKDVVDRVAKDALVPVVTDRKLSQAATDSFRNELVKTLRAAGYVAESYGKNEEVPVLEAIDLTFRSECRDAHNDQTDMTLYAEQHGHYAGHIDYTVFRGEVHVQYIKVSEQLRRQGVARALAKHLQHEYPDVEIEWGGLTDMGSDFLDALKREYLDNPTYGMLKKAYEQAKAEYDTLAKEFDVYDGPPLGQNPEMLAKGERLNELDTLIFDLESQLRDLKPGKWLIRESEDPREFMVGFEKTHAVGDWYGADLNTSTGPGAYLHSNKSRVLGPLTFSAFMRPEQRNDPDLDASFKLSTWAEDAVSKRTAACPNLWIRLSSTVGRPDWQPGNIDQFQADLKGIMGDAAEAGMAGGRVGRYYSFAQEMFVRVYGALKKKGWKMDVETKGYNWQLPESWTPDDMEQFVKKATTTHVDWVHGPRHNPMMDTTADEWIMHVHAPLGHLSENNNYVKVIFYPVREDGVQEVRIDGHFAAPVWYRSQLGGERDFIDHYSHLAVHAPSVIRPEDAESFRQAVEVVFNRTVGAAIDKTADPKSFRLSALSTKTKSAFTRLTRKFWVKGKTYGLVDPETIVKSSASYGGNS